MPSRRDGSTSAYLCHRIRNAPRSRRDENPSDQIVQSTNDAAPITFYLTAPLDEEPTRVRLAPALGSSDAGVILTRSF